MTPAYLLNTDWIIDHFNRIEPTIRKLGELRLAGYATSDID